MSESDPCPSVALVPLPGEHEADSRGISILLSKHEGPLVNICVVGYHICSMEVPTTSLGKSICKIWQPDHDTWITQVSTDSLAVSFERFDVVGRKDKCARLRRFVVRKEHLPV